VRVAVVSGSHRFKRFWMATLMIAACKRRVGGKREAQSTGQNYARECDSWHINLLLNKISHGQVAHPRESYFGI